MSSRQRRIDTTFQRRQDIRTNLASELAQKVQSYTALADTLLMESAVVTLIIDDFFEVRVDLFPPRLTVRTLDGTRVLNRETRDALKRKFGLDVSPVHDAWVIEGVPLPDLIALFEVVLGTSLFLDTMVIIAAYEALEIDGGDFIPVRVTDTYQINTRGKIDRSRTTSVQQRQEPLVVTRPERRSPSSPRFTTPTPRRRSTSSRYSSPRTDSPLRVEDL